MNTTKKGDRLEDKIFNQFKEDISAGRFWAKNESCKIYKKKGYYSNDRKKDIFFDVSVEIFLPNQTTYSVLLLIECKNYTHRVPVDDVEEFFAKAQQISGANIKTILVSNNSFQEGTFNFAESKGIGLLRYFGRNDLDWILTRSPSSLVSSDYATNESAVAYTAVHCEDFKSNHFDFYGFISYQYTASLFLFISSLINHKGSKEFIESLSAIKTVERKNTCLVEYKDVLNIEETVASILNEIDYCSGEVPLNKICAILKEEHCLKVIEDSSLDDGVLGQITFNPLVIKIDKGNESKERKKFTLAHEIGHFLLGHSEYMSGEVCHESSVDMDNTNDIGIKEVKRMEWQANQFASSLLLPKNDFVQSFLVEAARNEISNRGFGIIYLDGQECNVNSFFNVTSPLMKKYNVSRSVVKIRLKNMGLVKTQPRTLK